MRAILDGDKLCEALEENGAVAGRLPGYERRDAQLDLVRLITRAFNEDAIVAAEAGTGVGKSFAYLLPALEFALAVDERIVISTATITLQQQLYEKDIPLVLSALQKDVKCMLVKGRGNYICRRRLLEALLEPPLDEAEYGELRSIAQWVEGSPSGSRSDIAFLPSAALWSRICCEADTCMRAACAEKERCFFMTLRREAAEARILVVNHHLLFADLAARYEGAGYEFAVVLPPYTRVIIDEAHAIEGAATSFFSKELSRMGINRAITRLYRKRRARESGLLLRLGNLPPGIPKAAARVREAAEKADAAALALCGAEGLFRFTPEKTKSGGAVLFPHLHDLKLAIDALSERVLSFLENTDPEDPLVWEIKAILRRIEAAGISAAAFLEYADNEKDVFWLERQSGSQDPWAVFTITPINIAPSLRDALFDANKTVVCVSATLSTGERNQENGAEAFHFWGDRSGAALADRKFLGGIFPSPFPYAQRTILAVPQGAPLPDAPEYQAFVSAALSELIRVSGGSALVLFTSYRALRESYEEAAPLLEAEGIRCLKQGDDDRSRLLQQFLEDKTSVLFGTDSFWEGVDAPGDTLRLVILCRLPFRTLNDPVFEARREFLEKQGRNSFAELSLPDAVMKFKQGFGRLMRGSTDCGMVAVLDARILQKYYGSVFLDSLPETRRSFKDMESIVRDLEQLLY